MLKIEDFSKSYDGGKTFAVKNASFEVKKGEIVAFIGHNGSGKSTTLKAIAGIIEFDGGNIVVDGKGVRTHSLETKKALGYLPETVQMYEFLSGYQFLNFIADVYEISEQDRKERILYYAKLFNMDDALFGIIETYSHGMKQKTALISVLLHKPRLILLDEPFFGLDPQATFDFKNIMQQLAKEGVSLLYSTHVLEVAEKLATSVVVISKGKIVKQASMSEIVKDKSLEKYFLEIAND